MYENLDADNRVYLIYCDIGNYRHWIKESVSADKFFNNLDLLKSALKELTLIDYNYNVPTPEKELSDLCKKEQEIIRNFLARYWIKTVSEATKLKTVNGKSKKIKSFFDSLKLYEERFSEETLCLLEKAKCERPDYTLKKQSKAEKDKLFLVETEKLLDNQDNVMDKTEQNAEDFAWFFQNNYLLSRAFRKDIDSDIVYDIARLMLIKFNYKKAARFLRIKIKIDTTFATQLYITACSILESHKDIARYQQLGLDKYFIINNSSACPICQKLNGKIYSFSEAQIGTNYPPFCGHNCSTIGLYREK